MRPFEFVLAILAMVFIFRLVQMQLTHMHEKKKKAPTVDDELLDKLAVLEERVQVLERIVTDKQSDLEREFRDLRNGSDR